MWKLQTPISPITEKHRPILGEKFEKALNNENLFHNESYVWLQM